MNGIQRNQGLPLDLHWVRHCGVEDEQAAAIAAQYDREYPADQAQIRRIIGYIDLSSLNGDDTPHTIRATCLRAQDVAGDKVAAVAIYPVYVDMAVELLAGTGIEVAGVAGGFPHGLSPLSSRLDEIRHCVKAGAHEIDVVIRRSHALGGDWRALYNEVREMREAAGGASFKTILATGELRCSCTAFRAALVCMMAGADLVKTSTGKEAVNATLPAGVAMASAIRDYTERTGFAVGLKPAGGIRTADEAMRWIAMVSGELGTEWLRPELFRIGATKLVDDIESRLSSQQA